MINFMNTHDIDKFYISDYDKFLAEFDHTHLPSAAQLVEIKKHKKIANCRDHAYLTESNIWSEF